MFWQYLCDQILPAHSVAVLQFFPRDGNGKISENYVTIPSEKLLV